MEVNANNLTNYALTGAQQRERSLCQRVSDEG